MILRVLQNIEDILSYISAAAVAAMMMLTVADVTVRYLTTTNVPGSYEFVSLLFVFVIYLGLSLAQRENSHIAIDALYNKLPRKLRKGLETTQLSVLCIFSATLAWYCAGSAWENYLMGDTILGAISVVTWPSRTVIAIGLLILALRFLVQLIHLITRDILIEESVPVNPVEES